MGYYSTRIYVVLEDNECCVPSLVNHPSSPVKITSGAGEGH